jgi:hypothetical protein
LFHDGVNLSSTPPTRSDFPDLDSRFSRNAKARLCTPGRGRGLTVTLAQRQDTGEPLFRDSEALLDAVLVDLQADTGGASANDMALIALLRRPRAD